MKIQYIKGNLVDTDIKFIGHGVNCQGKMNSGVAKAIREKWPQTFDEYIDFISDLKPFMASAGVLLGFVNIVSISDSRFVLNIFSQERYGYDGQRYVSYDALAKAFSFINQLIPHYETVDPRVALPMIGSGLGGGNWNIITTIIEETLTNVQPVVYRID